MVRILRVFILVVLCINTPIYLFSQASTGIGAGFGVDGGLYTGILEYPSPSVIVATDDWFKGAGTGNHVIDTTDLSSIASLLQSALDPTYEVRMSAPQNSVNSGQIWIDALYARDNFGGTGFTDPTSFTTASKNGQDPATWATGTANVLGKNDLIDVAGHMRRDGQSLEEGDLWFFGLAVIAEPGGASYMDFEFFNETVDYVNGSFTSGGPDLGHTAFKFTNDWRISQVGDFIFSTDVSSSGISSVDMRIWISSADFQYIFNNSTPNLDFTLEGSFDGPFNGSPYGYAKILPLSSNFGQTNYTLTVGPPWGHKGTKFNSYNSSINEYSILELGVNLTEFGIDHISIEGADECDFPLNTFIVKTRSSASFTAQLKDFGGPFDWGRTIINAVIIGNTVLSCLDPTTTLEADPIRPDASYLWSTMDGQIIGDPTLPTIDVSQPGTYRLDMFVFLDDVPGGCAAEYAEVTVGYDPSKPFFEDLILVPEVSCAGNDGSINVTFSGGNPPYTFLWSNGETIQNLTGLSPDTYTLTITDDEGCVISETAIIPAPTPLDVIPTISNNLCFGARTGGISLQVTGKEPISFLWSNGNVSSSISSLGAGNYFVTITDGDGCEYLYNYTVTQPTAITRSVVKVDATNNDDPGNGSIDLTVSGGTPAYSFLWVKNRDAVITNPYSTDEDLTNLTRGIYSVTITDVNGCTSTISVSIGEPEICNDGIDNDGNGLTDCQELICIPDKPGVITPSDANPCINEAITYSVVNDPNLDAYVWTVPANATITGGQGTNSITVIWDTDQAGQICVQADKFGCLSSQECLLVIPDKVPSNPNEIEIDNN